jgi:hypothetical protein
MPANPPVQDWWDGYKQLVEAFSADGVKVLNISEDTHCPTEYLPRDDWRKYAKN